MAAGLDTTVIPLSALDDIFEAPDLSDLDPSTHGGFKIIYHREVPIEMRLQTTDVAPAEAGTLEAIACKVCVREGDDGRPKHVRVELSSEGDLFFHYSHTVDERLFNAMRDEQKLMVDFASYPSVLASSFTNAIKVRPTARGCHCHQLLMGTTRSLFTPVPLRLMPKSCRSRTRSSPSLL